MPPPKIQRQRQGRTTSSLQKSTDIQRFMNARGETSQQPSDESASTSNPTMADGEWRTVLSDSLKKTEDSICARLITKIDDLRKDLNEVSDRVTGLEHTTQVHETQIQDDKNRHDDQIKKIQDAILLDRVYQRKYNLLLYGIPESREENAETCVRDFIHSKLGLDQAKVDAILFANVHRLPRVKKLPGTDNPIIMKFISYPMREEVFRLARQNGPKLRDMRVSLRSDLPPELKAIRGKLASKAYDIRKNQGHQTRITERGIAVTLEVRESSERPWKRVCLDDNP